MGKSAKRLFAVRYVPVLNCSSVRYVCAEGARLDMVCPSLCGYCVLPECLTREAALAVCFTCIFLCVLFLALFTYEVVDDDIDDLRDWARRPWTHSNCTVLDSGIEYRGDCFKRNYVEQIRIADTKTPKYNYTRCPASRLSDSQCRAFGSLAYKEQLQSIHFAIPHGHVETPRRLVHATVPPPLLLKPAVSNSTDVLLRLAVEAKDLSGPRQRIVNAVPPAPLILPASGTVGSAVSFGQVVQQAKSLLPERRLAKCMDVFMPWAVVVADGHPEVMCGSRTGIDPVSNEIDFAVALDTLQNDLRRGASLQCWLLRMASDEAGLRRCTIAALQDPVNWPDKQKDWIEEQDWLQTMFLHCALGCAVVAAVFGVLAYKPGALKRVLGQYWPWFTKASSSYRFGRLGVEEPDEEADEALWPGSEDEVGGQRGPTLHHKWQMFRAEVLAGHGGGSGETGKPAPAE